MTRPLCLQPRPVQEPRRSAGRGVVHSERTPEVALYAPTTPFVLDGRSIGPRHLWWNFVSGETERIPAPPWRPAAGS